jgi:hypothetical protein
LKFCKTLENWHNLNFKNLFMTKKDYKYNGINGTKG